MEQYTIRNFKVTIFYSYNGTQLFITDPQQIEIYAHKVSGDAKERAIEVINRYAPEEAVVEAVEETVPAKFHFTNDGRKIAFADLTDEHLLNILPKVKFSLKRFDYYAEVERRNLQIV